MPDILAHRLLLVSASLLSKIQDCYYGSILISDHGLCCLIYADGNLVRDPPRWNLNQKWLQDEEFVKYVGKEIDNYFTANTTQTTAGIKWDAFKAYLRGHIIIISYTSSKSRESRQKRQQLESRIQTLQEQVFRNRTPAVEKELLLLKAEYDKLSATRAASSMLRLNQTFYEQGGKTWQTSSLADQTASNKKKHHFNY